MRVDVLGPVALSDDHNPVSVGGPRQQAVLAVLGLLGGSVVPTAALADTVWSGTPPRTAEHTLHNYVLRLRRLGVQISRVADGYRLDTATDAAVAEQALASGQGVGHALSLVRGLPGQGLADSDLTRARCVELAETVEALREAAAADALAAAGGPAGAARLVPELRGLATAAPYRERRWELLMLALYRAGRQSEALEAFAQARALLGADLGIDPSPGLRRLQQAVLSQDPALTSSDRAPRTGVAGGGRALPGLATRLVGRNAELAAVAASLAASRLVTIVGPLGAGKTRLALEVAHRQPGQVWFVPIEGLTAPMTVAECALAAVAPTSRAGDAVAGLLESLATSRGLLVVDGSEAHIEEVARLATSLLAAAPDVRLLVTSRQSLRLRDEATVPIAALDRAERRQLLADRARLADPMFTLADRDLEMADRLCALVDGLPLGIELVARHLRLLTVAELTSRVDADLDRWTTGASEEAAGLVGAVAAGVDELPEQVRRLLIGVAVLPAEADIALIHRAVAPGTDEAWVFDALATLVDRSLVQVRGGPLGVRYALLLSVRRCCLDLLDAAERTAIEKRYVTAVLQRVSQLASGLRSPERSAVLAALDADEPHLQWALAASVEGGGGREPLTVATGLADYWLARRPSEGMAWLQRLLAGSDVAGADRAAVLLQMGHFAYWLTDFERGTELLSEARRLLHDDADPLLLGRVLRRMGAIAAATDEIDTARALLQESATVLDGGDEAETAVSLLHLGSLLADESRTDEALPILIRALEALRSAGDPLLEAHALAALNLAWWKSGDLVAARGAGERALVHFQALGHRPSEGVIGGRLASITRSLGDREAAGRYVETALEAGRASGTRTTSALALLARARLRLDATDIDGAASDLRAALEPLDSQADRWVLAEAVEVAAYLQVHRGQPALALLDCAAELRVLIGQPAPPAHAAELERLRASPARTSDEDAAGAAPPATDPGALRAWLIDACVAGPAPIPVGGNGEPE